MEIFICRKCNKEKLRDEFDKDLSKQNGIRTQCKECRSQYNKNLYNLLIAEEKPQLEQLWCFTCKEYKSTDMFYSQRSSKTGFNSNCQNCVLQYNKVLRGKYPEQYKEHGRKNSQNRRKAHSIFLEEYKSNKPCIDCGKMFPACCMDFDHILGEKAFNISGNNTAGAEILIKEIAKCELVCSNCHRIRTKLRLGLSKSS